MFHKLLFVAVLAVFALLLNLSIRGGVHDGFTAVLAAEQSPEYPRYVHATSDHGAGAGGWKEKATGIWITDAYFEDVDVSWDGEYWFHLLGDSCWSGYAKITIPKPNLEGSTFIQPRHRARPGEYPGGHLVE